jgi:hypothetical protein
MIPTSEIDMSDLCEDWADSERMRVMFAPMRNRELNPESYDSKIQFWRGLIKKWCSVQDKCSLTQKELESAFQRDGDIPHCLAEVLSESIKSGDFMDSNRFRASLTPQQNWGGWIKSIGVRAAQSFGDSVLGHNPEHVVIPDLAETLMRKNATEIRKRDPWLQRHNVCFQKLSGPQSEEMLEYLGLKHMVQCCDIDSVRFIKYSCVSDNIEPFNDSDFCLIKLKLTLETLDDEILKQEEELSNLKLKVKENLKSGSRISAKTTLKRQKMVEAKLQQKLDQQMNIETLVEELLNVDSNKSVIQSYKTGVEELKSRLSDLNTDNVEEIMDDLRDVIQESDDIGDALGAKVLNESLDEEELEKELQKLSEDGDSRDQTDKDRELLQALDKLDLNQLDTLIGPGREELKETGTKVLAATTS